MNMSERVREITRERTKEQMLHGIHGKANERKRQIYWTGFLSGLLASNRIEEGEPEALLAEAEHFCSFFHDNDAEDLIADLKACFHSDAEDLIQCISLIIEAKQEEIGLIELYEEKDHCNEFLGFCAGVICDGTVLPKEVRAIAEKFQKSPYLANSTMFCELQNALTFAFADGVITPSECEEIAEWIAALVGDGYSVTGLASQETLPYQGLNPITDGAQIKIEGSCFVLTGAMQIGPRSFICSEIEACGGITKKNVSNSIDYVVVASSSSPHWKTSHFGTKIMKARELIEKGGRFCFATEHALANAIKVSKENYQSAKA